MAEWFFGFFVGIGCASMWKGFSQTEMGKRAIYRAWCFFNRKSPILDEEHARKDPEWEVIEGDYWSQKPGEFIHKKYVKGIIHLMHADVSIDTCYSHRGVMQHEPLITTEMIENGLVPPTPEN